jgi:hypothetical protein
VSHCGNVERDNANDYIGVDFCRQEWLNEEVTNTYSLWKTRYFRSSVMQDNFRLIKGIPFIVLIYAVSK